ncbi:MAG: FprA family A-type flavoprotein [Acetivibrio sp.]
MQKITDTIYNVGVNDTTLDLFESQYKVPQGISYNSYLILEEKVVLLDTVDKRVTEEWLDHLDELLNGRKVDYLIISHMEPDHAANINKLLERYPDLLLVGNTKTFKLMSQFFNIEVSKQSILVNEGDVLPIGTHQFQFYMAPMVHWPEVMVTYERTEKVLFSADAFGKFGTMEDKENWEEEARRYYFNICGKYGMPVQTLLKKAKTLELCKICPLHGPVIEENLSDCMDKYHTWSSYLPEEEGVVVAYGSIHGNTKKAAQKMVELLKEAGKEKVEMWDLARSDMSEVLAETFRYSQLILAAPTYDSGIFPCMEEFLLHLRAKGYQKRSVGIIENGSWAPQAGKHMKKILEEMKEIDIKETMVTICSTLKDADIETMKKLIAELS